MVDIKNEVSRTVPKITLDSPFSSFFFHFPLFVWGAVPVTEAVFLVTRNNMHMGMKHYLSCSTTIIDTNINSICPYRLFDYW